MSPTCQIIIRCRRYTLLIPHWSIHTLCSKWINTFPVVFQMIYRINAKHKSTWKLSKRKSRFCFLPRRTVGRLDGTDLWMSQISLAYWHWLQIISVVFEGLTVAWCCLQWRVRLVWSCVGCGWLMMRKVSQTGSLALHFQTTSRGVVFTVFNQQFRYDDSLSISTQRNLMTTMKLSWPFLLV